ENITRCPALTKSAPSAPPSRPAPMVLMLRGGPGAGCARTRAGKDPTVSPTMPPATVRRKLRRPFSIIRFVMVRSPTTVVVRTHLQMETEGYNDNLRPDRKAYFRRNPRFAAIPRHFDPKRKSASSLGDDLLNVVHSEGEWPILCAGELH